MREIEVPNLDVLLKWGLRNASQADAASSRFQSLQKSLPRGLSSAGHWML